MSGPFRRLVPLATAALAPASTGAKAAGLAAALHAGFPVLPGWVVPVAAGRPALADAAAAVREAGMAAGRRAVLRRPVEPVLARESREAVHLLGGRVIARSSSPLESDSRWSGAFSSVAGVGADDAVTAVRSCWSSAFAVDPLERLQSSGLPLEALELAVLLQPEIDPEAGGTARVIRGEVTVEAVAGHPAALLSGWAEPLPGPELTGLIGAGALSTVADLAGRVHQELGDDTIEWAASDGRIWLLQSLRTGGAAGPPHGPAARAGEVTGPDGAATAAGTATPPGGGIPEDHLVAREQMPLLAAAVATRGTYLPARPAAPGTAAGRLVACRPHEHPPGGLRDAILLVDRPVPALAPLLFAARGVIARAGGTGSHLAEVARSLGVPMVTGCRQEAVTGAGPLDGGWLAALDGTTGDVALLRSSAPLDAGA